MALLEKMMRLSIPAILILITAPSARADGLADLKSALARLNGHEPSAVRIDYQVSRTTSLGKKSSAGQCEVTVRAAEDASTLDMAWDRETVGKVNQEAQRHDQDPYQPTPIRDALRDLDPGRVSHLLDQTGILENLVAGSRFLEEKAEPWEGRPARVLVFQFQQRLPLALRARLISSEAFLKIWIAEDGRPLGSESTTQYRGRRGRIFGMYEGHGRLFTRYAVVKGRLMVAERRSEERRSDSDRDERDETRTKLTLEPVP